MSVTVSLLALPAVWTVVGAGGDVEVAGKAVLVPLQRALAILLSDLGELVGA